MCGATVQSLNHVRAMTETQYNKETEEVEIVGVTETRFTGFLVHALIASTVFLLPLCLQLFENQKRTKNVGNHCYKDSAHYEMVTFG